MKRAICFEQNFKQTSIYFLVPLATIHYQLEKHCQERTQNHDKVAWCVHAFICYAAQQSSATLGLEQHTEAAHFSRGKKQSIFIHRAYYCGFYHLNSKDSFTIFWGHEPYCCMTLLWWAAWHFCPPIPPFENKVRPAFISLISNMLDISYLNFFTWAVSARKGAKKTFPYTFPMTKRLKQKWNHVCKFTFDTQIS